MPKRKKNSKPRGIWFYWDSGDKQYKVRSSFRRRVLPNETFSSILAAFCSFFPFFSNWDWRKAVMNDYTVNGEKLPFSFSTEKEPQVERYSRNLGVESAKNKQFVPVCSIYCKRSEITFLFTMEKEPRVEAVLRRNSGVEAARNKQFASVYSIITEKESLCEKMAGWVASFFKKIFDP